MNYLDLALQTAKEGWAQANHKHYMLGAVCLRQDGVIVAAHNIRTASKAPSAHAEARVLKKAGFGAILWVARINRLGQAKLAMPCHHCQVLIRNMRVKVCHYTITDNVYGTWKVG